MLLNYKLRPIEEKKKIKLNEKKNSSMCFTHLPLSNFFIRKSNQKCISFSFFRLFFLAFTLFHSIILVNQYILFHFVCVCHRWKHFLNLIHLYSISVQNFQLIQIVDFTSQNARGSCWSRCHSFMQVLGHRVSTGWHIVRKQQISIYLLFFIEKKLEINSKWRVCVKGECAL